jgi:hypothetical protein
MGLLDDAIREHLDLKRRRGADPTEVQREEHEALGPVRRGPEPTGVDEAGVHDDELEVEGALGHDDVRAPDNGFEPFETTPAPALDRREDLGPPLDTDWDDPFADEPEPAPRRSDPDALEPPASPRRPAEPELHPGDPTVEYDVEDALSRDSEEGDDVLEETPDFLQDTPEHDRLWFEQKPPRDFKFDD